MPPVSAPPPTAFRTARAAAVNSIRLRQTGAVHTSSVAATGWTAPRAAEPLDATVVLPGSKSLTNRAGPGRPGRRAVPAAAPCEPGHPVDGRGAARAGTEVRDDGEDWLVAPAPLPGGTVDCGLAGTVMRFVPAGRGARATARSPSTATPSPAAGRWRPCSTRCGAARGRRRRTRLPFTVHGTGAVAGRHGPIDASRSSQFVSGLLLPVPVTTTGSRSCAPAAARAVAAAHRDDRRGAAGGRGGGGRRRAGPGGSLRGRSRPWTTHRARPVQRGALPGRGGRHRRHVTHPGWPARTTQAGDAHRARCWPRWAPTSTAATPG